jgi:phage terminase large subunit-like protein
LPREELDGFLDGLTPNALMALPWLFELWAIEGHQLPPEGDWTTWLILGGRGAGETRAGAEWVRAQVEGGRPGDPGACSRVALVGATLDEAREVMVFGDTGIL